MRPFLLSTFFPMSKNFDFNAPSLPTLLENLVFELDRVGPLFLELLGKPEGVDTVTTGQLVLVLATVEEIVFPSSPDSLSFSSYRTGYPPC